MARENETVTHIHQPQPATEKITITRGQRGAVGWEVQAGSVARALELDRELAAKLTGEEA